VGRFNALRWPASCDLPGWLALASRVRHPEIPALGHEVMVLLCQLAGFGTGLRFRPIRAFVCRMQKKTSPGYSINRQGVFTVASYISR